MYQQLLPPTIVTALFGLLLLLLLRYALAAMVWMVGLRCIVGRGGKLLFRRDRSLGPDIFLVAAGRTPTGNTSLLFFITYSHLTLSRMKLLGDDCLKSNSCVGRKRTHSPFGNRNRNKDHLPSRRAWDNARTLRVGTLESERSAALSLSSLVHMFISSFVCFFKPRSERSDAVSLKRRIRFISSFDFFIVRSAWKNCVCSSSFIPKRFKVDFVT